MAWAMVWLEAFTCISRLLSSGSLKTSHQFPCSVASEGCASFQPCAASESGTFSSLYAGGVSTGGRAYLGPTLQPGSILAAKSAEMTNDVRRIMPCSITPLHLDFW